MMFLVFLHLGYALEILLRTRYFQELLKNLGGKKSSFFHARFFLKPPRERII
jgi:hypothetical protein